MARWAHSHLDAAQIQVCGLMADKRNRGIILILLAFFGLGVLYSVTVPLFEAPDEDGHYTYMRYMAQERGLPVIRSRSTLYASRSPSPVSPYVINHPPLYYGLAGLATSWIDMEPLEDAAWYNPHFDYGTRGLRGNKNAVIHTQKEAFPYRGTSLAVHIGRWVSLLLGGGAVWGTYLLALELFPEQRWLALGAAAVTAFNPQFLFISARLGNDGAVAGFCSLALWATVRFFNREQAGWQPIWLGTFLGLALLSKVNAIGLLPVVVLAILLKAIRKRSIRSFVLWGGMTFGVALAIAGWWYARNEVLYGDPLLWKAHLTLVPRREPTPSLGQLYRHEFGSLETSFWAVFGWMNIPVQEWIFWVLRILTRVAALGLVKLVLSPHIGSYKLQVTSCKLPKPSTCNLPVSCLRRQGPTDRQPATSTERNTQPGLWITVLWLVILFLSLLQFMRVQPGAQGRYLFPGISAISLLLLLGLSQWVPQRFHPPLAAALAGGLFLLALLCPFIYIRPAYSHPLILSPEQVPDDLNRLEVDFGGQMELLGARVGKQALRPGQRAEVTLCWRSLTRMDRNYSVFLHLFGRGWEKIGQLDIYPGVGSYPTSLWQAGDIICDDYEIPISSEATTPAAARMEVGLYDRGSMERLPPLDAAGRPLGQVIVGRVKIVPRQWPQ
ncbi:MAG: glycosyltransferase family 39 protein, partial [Chloroflexota bacterium]|nr:glycosyltransferase family 39 protein [Chloroflexota bacterium]